MNNKHASSPRPNAAQREAGALRRFKDLMKKNAGKLAFVGHRD